MQAALTQQGVRLSTYQEIQIRPKLDNFSFGLAGYRNNTSYLSAGEYLNMFENRIEVIKDELGYEDRGFFGSVKWAPKYRIYTNRAAYAVEEKIRQTFTRNIERAQQWIDRSYWQPFLKELQTEAAKRLEAVWKEAEAATSQAEQAAEKPYQSVLNHLDALQKEVSR